MQGVKLTLLNKQFILFANSVLRAYRMCKAVDRANVGENEDWQKEFGSPSSGFAVVMGALHLCRHVSVYGIGEDKLLPVTPYQVRAYVCWPACLPVFEWRERRGDTCLCEAGIRWAWARQR